MGDVISKLWKSDDGKKRSFKDLLKSLEKIENEFRLLLILGESIFNPKEESPDITRTLRDSFLIHFRRIHNFLYSKEPDSDTIIAEDFFETADKWKSTRIKEAKIVKEFEELANRVILSFTYDDEEEILGISGDDFKNAVDEISKPFQQFIELNQPVDIPDETTMEIDDQEKIPAKEIEVEVVEKEYGAGKVMYRTVILEDGYLEVQVLHANQTARNYIRTHQDEPEFFYDNIDKLEDHNHTARNWLAEIAKDYQSYFEENTIKFVMK